MTKTKYSIVYTSEINNVVELNSSFDKGVLRVAYWGNNRNKSYISKESFEKAIGSIYNCPIVCNYMREEEEIGGHDVELVHCSEGMKLVNITEPVGIVPESANYWWEEVEDEGGIHEYLCVDVLLWKRQEAYSHIKEKGITEESMEITVKSGRLEDGIFIIEDFEFTAFCLLGNVEPCYEGAALHLFEKNEIQAQFSAMLFELREYIENIKPEGGNTVKNTENIQKTFALSGEQFKEELITALRAVTIESEYGTYSKYCYMDFDAEKKEVYCYDTEDWKLYGFRFKQSNDSVAVDFDSKKRKKFVIADFEEGAADNTSLDTVFEQYSAVLSASVEKDCKAEFEAKLGEINSELADLRSYKLDKERAEKQEIIQSIFAQFSDLSGVPDYENLKSGADAWDHPAAELQERCFAIRGKLAAPKTAELAAKIPKLPVEKGLQRSEPYGGLFAKYSVE